MNELNKTLEAAALAREKVIREANKGASWIERHPYLTLGAVLAMLGVIFVLAIKAYA